MATEIISKRCTKCKQTKPLSEFSKQRRTKDGLKYWCKSCVKACQKAYRQTERGKTTHSKGNVKYFKTPKGKAVKRKDEAKRKIHNPNYFKAKDAVNNAIKTSRLPRANTLLCHYCPAQAQEYHHWHGYEPKHWLDVVPACIECHKKEHKKP